MKCAFRNSQTCLVFSATQNSSLLPSPHLQDADKEFLNKCDKLLTALEKQAPPSAVEVACVFSQTPYVHLSLNNANAHLSNCNVQQLELCTHVQRHIHASTNGDAYIHTYMHALLCKPTPSRHCWRNGMQLSIESKRHRFICTHRDMPICL